MDHLSGREEGIEIEKKYFLTQKALEKLGNPEGVRPFRANFLHCTVLRSPEGGIERSCNKLKQACNWLQQGENTCNWLQQACNWLQQGENTCNWLQQVETNLQLVATR